MNPSSGFHSRIADAKSFGSFRATVTCAPSSVKRDGQDILIGECWLEQRLKQDYIYSPWGETDVTFLCVNLSCNVDRDWWPHLHQVPPPNSCTVRASNLPTRLSPSPFRSSCVVSDSSVPIHFTYAFPLRLKAMLSNQVAVDFGRKQMPGFDNQEGLPPQLVVFSWSPVQRTKPNLNTIAYALVYWPVAITFHLIVVVPISLLNSARNSKRKI